MEGLQKWRVRGGIWRGMQNGGLFGGPAGDGFFTKPPNFVVETHMEAPAGDAQLTKQQSSILESRWMNRSSGPQNNLANLPSLSRGLEPVSAALASLAAATAHRRRPTRSSLLSTAGWHRETPTSYRDDSRCPLSRPSSHS
jgi:hypothetical protein